LVAGAALMMAPCLTARAQEPDGPASAELRAIVKADQDARKWWMEKRPATEAETKELAKDPERLARVKELLAQDKIVTREDFDNAALLFQHGATPDDYLIAHELAMVVALKRDAGNIDNMLVLSEDRFLGSIGRPQRFGSQGVNGAKPGEVQIQPTDESGDYAVTDALRADLFMAPLAASKAKGPMALMDHIDALGKRLKERYDPQWQAEAAKRPESAGLALLASGNIVPTEDGVKSVLELYRADKLATPDDYRNAADVLARSAQGRSGEDAARRLLLAHELAEVAALRGQKAAPRLWAATWDRFLFAIGQAPRYGTVAGARPRASGTVRRILGVSP
jgi:hypothetical protein